MKKSKANVATYAVIIVLVAYLVGRWAWNELQPGMWYDVRTAVRDLSHARNTEKAREKLRHQTDREYVLGKLRDALDDEDGSVRGKIEILRTLDKLKESRTVRLAVESKILSTQRAAIWMRQGDPAIRDLAQRVVLDWLKDKGADARVNAVILAGNLKLEDAVPALIGILDEHLMDDEGVRTTVQAIFALSRFKPKGVTDKLMAVAKDTTEPSQVRIRALEAAAGLENAPRDEIVKMAVAIVKDKSADVGLRVNAASILGRPDLGSPEVWDALESVLLDPKDHDWITQRTCLQALGRSAPIERLRKLLFDSRVDRHPYFAIRVDVATALAALNVRERKTLQILDEYLVDRMPDDHAFQVPQEAYLSLYVLTGAAFGIPEKDLFNRRVRPIPDPEKARPFLFAAEHARRPGNFTRKHIEAVKRIASDLAKMKEVKDHYDLIQETFLKAWEDEAKAAAKKAEGKGEGETKDGGKKDDGAKAADGAKKDEGATKNDGAKKDEGANKDDSTPKTDEEPKGEPKSDNGSGG